MYTIYENFEKLLGNPYATEFLKIHCLATDEDLATFAAGTEKAMLSENKLFSLVELVNHYKDFWNGSNCLLPNAGICFTVNFGRIYLHLKGVDVTGFDEKTHCFWREYFPNLEGSIDITTQSLADKTVTVAALVQAYDAFLTEQFENLNVQQSAPSIDQIQFVMAYIDKARQNPKLIELMENESDRFAELVQEAYIDCCDADNANLSWLEHVQAYLAGENAQIIILSTPAFAGVFCGR